MWGALWLEWSLEVEAFQSLTERFRCNSRKGLIFAVKFGKLLRLFATDYRFLTFCWGWLILGVFHFSVRFGDYLSAFQEELQQLLVDVVAKMEACISYLAYDCLQMVFGCWDPLDSKQSKGQVLLTYHSPPMSRNRWGMVTEVGDILEAKSELCKDDPCDFNIKTGSLRLYHPGVYKSQWDVQERLKDWKAVGGVGSRFNRTHTRYACHHLQIRVSQYFPFW